MLGIDASRGAVPTTDNPTVSVVVPVHNEAGNLPLLIDRVSTSLASVSFEILFVDDGSADDSLAILKKAAASDRRLKVLSFSRNFGHQVAVTAGMEHATGQAIVIIDADLQDPPEVIPEMIAKWKEGFDVVYGRRSQREGETWAKKATAKIFYRLIGGLTNFEMPVDTGDFRLVSRRAASAFLAMPERHRFVRGMFSWVGFKQTGVLYHRQQRHVGKTSYTYKKMIRLALDGITSFSNVPLHLASYLGFSAAAVGFLLILYSLYQKFYGIGTMKGWTSLSIIVLFIGGIQLLVIGVLGQYIGRMQDELKRRPLYVVQESVNT